MRFSNWDIRGFDREAAVELCHSGINPLVSVLMASRYGNKKEEIMQFLDTQSAPYHNPYLMQDMDKAVERINKAVAEKEKIAVYGDYDVDGMTSTAVVALWLKSKNADYEVYIPKRSGATECFGEGYGLSVNALDTLKAKGIGLVITVDCGITATDEAEHAKKIGLGLVITDHHECRASIPDADAVINPKRPDCKYPYKSLAGVGVAFKLVCALENDYLSDGIFNRYGRFLALGTIADVMPVTGENRKLICAGLGILNTNPGAGLKELINEACRDTEKITTSSIGFALAPRLNAAGRMGDPMLSVRLLLTDDPLEAKELVGELCHLNNERRKLEQEIYDNAMTMLPEDEQGEPVILSSSEWNQGVTGVVASRIAEKFRLPTIIISINEAGVGRGSCRSNNGFDIYNALSSCKDILLNYGGHTKAAGMDIAPENIEQLRCRITDIYNAFKSGNSGTNGLLVDFEVEKPDLLTISNIEALRKMEPFGNENPLPCLCIKNANLTAIQSIGAGKHTRLKVEKNNTVFACIFFSVSTDDLGLSIGDDVDIAFEPQVNEFRGNYSVQLQLQDIRPVCLDIKLSEAL